MKKSTVFLFSLFLVALSFIGCKKKQSAKIREVVVYTYDSWCDEWGAGPGIAELFEKQTGIKVTYVNCDKGIQILSRAILEKENPDADVLLGIDNNFSAKAIYSGILDSYQPKNLFDKISKSICTELNDGEEIFLVPYDYSHFSVNYDTQSSVPAPNSLEDLCNPIYKNKLIIMDPRTSTPGLGFVAWTLAVFGEGYKDFWKDINLSILTMSPSWSTGYGLYTKGEAPLVVSYTSSPAYHVEYDKTERYISLEFAEGHVRQIEGAGIVKNAPHISDAKKFIDFLISEDAQNLIPLNQWMYPVNKNVELPPAYKFSKIPEKTLSYNPSDLENAVSEIIETLNK